MSIEIPCESTPERSVSTITSAVVRTSPASIPQAVRIDVICCRTRSAGTFIGRAPFAGHKFYRQRSLGELPVDYVSNCVYCSAMSRPTAHIRRATCFVSRNGVADLPEAAAARPCRPPTTCAGGPGGDIRQLLGVPYGRAVCGLPVLGGGADRPCRARPQAVGADRVAELSPGGGLQRPSPLQGDGLVPAGGGDLPRRAPGFRARPARELGGGARDGALLTTPIRQVPRALLVRGFPRDGAGSLSGATRLSAALRHLLPGRREHASRGLPADRPIASSNEAREARGRSLGADVRLLDESRPLRGLGFHERAELVGRAAD